MADIGVTVIDLTINQVVNLFGSMEMAIFFLVGALIVGAVLTRYDRVGIVFTGLMFAGTIDRSGAVIPFLFPVALVVAVAYAVMGILGMGGEN